MPSVCAPSLRLLSSCSLNSCLPFNTPSPCPVAAHQLVTPRPALAQSCSFSSSPRHATSESHTGPPPAPTEAVGSAVPAFPRLSCRETGGEAEGCWAARNNRTAGRALQSWGVGQHCLQGSGLSQAATACRRQPYQFTCLHTTVAADAPNPSLQTTPHWPS